jgi:hypothetical protein
LDIKHYEYGLQRSGPAYHRTQDCISPLNQLQFDQSQDFTPQANQFAATLDPRFLTYEHTKLPHQIVAAALPCTGSSIENPTEEFSAFSLSHFYIHVLVEIQLAFIQQLLHNRKQQRALPNQQQKHGYL